MPRGARVVEVGAGPGRCGPSRASAGPTCAGSPPTSSRCPWNDVAADAGRLPLRDGCARRPSSGLDVLHHLPDPAAFFCEAARVLVPGGRLAPASSPGSARCRGRSTASFTRRTAGSASIPGVPFPANKASFDGDAALPWRIVRDAREADWRRFGLGPPRVTRLNAFAYLLSLGFRPASLLPWAVVGPARRSTAGRGALAPLTALRAFLVWQQASTDADAAARLDAWTLARIVAAARELRAVRLRPGRGRRLLLQGPVLLLLSDPALRGGGAAAAARSGSWNPYVNEGVPVMLPPVAYPVDLLQALGAERVGLLAAARAARAARRAHVPGPRPDGSGTVRGPRRSARSSTRCRGFSLSCVNLYLHVEAFAWAPLVISMLIRASSGGAREVAAGGRGGRRVPVHDRGRDRGAGGRLRLRAGRLAVGSSTSCASPPACSSASGSRPRRSWRSPAWSRGAGARPASRSRSRSTTPFTP